jgi:hypothetical protein
VYLPIDIPKYYKALDFALNQPIVSAP